MTSVHTLNVLAGLTWYVGAAALLSKGTRLLLQAESINGGRGWPWLALIIGVLIGVIKARYLLFKSCQKNLSRIANLPNPQWWQFFRPRFFVFLAVVITLGISASRQAEGHYAALCVIGAVDLSVGAGLLLSSAAFFKIRVVVSPSSVVTGED
jgi:hypothetical protein